MMIEQNTNYAYKLKYMGNPTFDKVRELSTKFYRELPQALQDELYDALNRGVDILDSEPQMTTYLYAFGKMHQAKLEYSFSKLPKEFLELSEINIIDYGCGQALGTMCYADFLRENGYSQKVKTVTLIEPSEICLKRAALHVSVFFPKAEIITLNNSFDELAEDDFYRDEGILYYDDEDEDIPTLHVFSNVLDILDFELQSFAEKIRNNINGYNQFVCVGPFFNFSDKDDRMMSFYDYLDGDKIFYETLDKYELDPKKAWTSQILCFSHGKLIPTEVYEDDINNGVEDDFGVVYSKDKKRLLVCNNKNIETYSIEYNTIVICDGAFSGCTFLRDIIIPNPVRSIGACAFSNCKSLRQIIIPDSVTSLGGYSFNECSSLEQIKISKSITKIEEGTFSDCKALSQITIPDSITTIRIFAFSDCCSLQQIIISEDNIEKFKQLLPKELWDKLYYLKKVDVNLKNEYNEYNDLPF